jgi:hypothetical protein
MFSSSETKWRFLDGGIISHSGYGWGSHSWTVVEGAEALRAVAPRHVAQNPARDPNRAGFISHRLGLGHLNVSDTNFPIGLCQAGGVLGCPGLLGRGSLGYLPGRGFRLLIANCSNGHSW